MPLLLDVGIVAPLCGTCMPGTKVIVEHVMNCAILTNNIVGAHLRTLQRKRFEGLLTAVLSRVMDVNKIGFA